MGDLNTNLLSDSSDMHYLRYLFSELSLKVIKHGPRHFPLGGRPSWIDLVCVDDIDTILASGIEMPTFYSLYAKIEVTLEKFVPSCKLNQFIYRNIKAISADRLAERLNGCDWFACQPEGRSADAVLDCISENLRGAIEKLAPQKTVTPK